MISFCSEINEKKVAQCEKLISNNEYEKARVILEKLIDNDYKNSRSKYLLAFCYSTDPSKLEKAIKLLESLLKDAAVGDKVDIQILLSRYYHQNYQFDDAATIYKYLDTTLTLGKLKSVKSIARLRDDYKVLIEQCNSAKKLLESITAVEVKVAKNIEEKQFVSSYRKVVGRDIWKTRSYIVKPTSMYSIEDKKEGEQMLIHQVGHGNTRVYSENVINKFGRRHKDLVYEVKEKRADWFERSYVGNLVNSAWDEDYTYLSVDSNTLYFSSNGKESMGGYDIFKSEKDTVTGYWGKPINLGFPINTPYDEVMYVKDNLLSKAYFSSNRFSGSQSFDLFELSIAEHEHIPYTFIINRKVDNDTLKIKEVKVSNYNNPSFNFMVTLADSGSKYLLMVNQLERYLLDVNFSNGDRFSSDVLSLSPKVSVGSSFNIVSMDSTYVLKKKNISTGQRDSKMLKLLLSSSVGGSNDTITRNDIQNIVLSDSLNLNLLRNQYKEILQVLHLKERLYSKLHQKIEERIVDLANWMQFKAGRGGSKLQTQAERRLNYLVIEIQSFKQLEKELTILKEESLIMRRIQFLNNSISEIDNVSFSKGRVSQLYKKYVFSFDSLKTIHRLHSNEQGEYYNKLIKINNKIARDNKAVENDNFRLDSRLALLNEELSEAQRQFDNSWWKRRKRRLQKTIDLINNDISEIGKVVLRNTNRRKQRESSVELITRVFEVADYRYSLPNLVNIIKQDSSFCDLGYLDTLSLFQKKIIKEFSGEQSTYALPYCITDDKTSEIVDSVWSVSEKDLRSSIFSLKERLDSVKLLPENNQTSLKDSAAITEVENEIIKYKEDKALSLVYHPVNPGETIYYLARLYNVSVKEIKSWNGKTNFNRDGIDWDHAKRIGEHRNWLYVGEKIKIYANPKVKKHKVKSGESLRLIAIQYEMSKEELKELNALSQLHPKGIDWESSRRSGYKFEWLYVGEQLIVK